MTSAASRIGPEPPNPSDSAEVRALREEVAQLRHAMHAHATVDQAMGVVIAVGALTPEESWDVLREISMRTNTKLRLVAEQLVTWGRTAVLDPTLRRELERQLTLRREERAVRAARAPAEGPPLPDRCGGER